MTSQILRNLDSNCHAFAPQISKASALEHHIDIDAIEERAVVWIPVDGETKM